MRNPEDLNPETEYQADNQAREDKQADKQQANIQVELSNAGAKPAYKTRCHHARRGYRS